MADAGGNLSIWSAEKQPSYVLGEVVFDASVCQFKWPHVEMVIE